MPRISPGALVLRRDFELGVESFGGAAGPVGIAEKFPSEENHVGLFAGEDGVGLSRIGDHTDSSRGYANFFADGFRKFNLIAGANGNFHAGNGATAGNINEIDTNALETPAQFDALFEIPAAFFPVGGGDANKKWIGFRPDFTDGLSDPD